MLPGTWAAAMVHWAVAARAATAGVVCSLMPLSAGICSSTMGPVTCTTTTRHAASQLVVLETINSFDLFVYLIFENAGIQNAGIQNYILFFFYILKSEF